MLQHVLHNFVRVSECVCVNILVRKRLKEQYLTIVRYLSPGSKLGSRTKIEEAASALVFSEQLRDGVPQHGCRASIKEPSAYRRL